MKKVTYSPTTRYATLGLLIGGGVVITLLWYIQHLQTEIDQLKQTYHAQSIEQTQTITTLQTQKSTLEGLLTRKLSHSLCHPSDNTLVRQPNHHLATLPTPTHTTQTPPPAPTTLAVPPLPPLYQEAPLPAPPPPSTSYAQQLITQVAKSKLDLPYVWGAEGPNCYDCSGFTSQVFKELGVWIPRTSRSQSSYGRAISKSKLQSGDLLFFATAKKDRNRVNHVGIYLGDGRFIHASSAKKGVVITPFDTPFYQACYKGARRIIN